MGPPSAASVARIFATTIESMYASSGSAIGSMYVSPSSAKKSVIAHEIAHCVNLHHCPRDEGRCVMKPRADVGADFHSHHDPDYDLVRPTDPDEPQTPYSVSPTTTSNNVNSPINTNTGTSNNVNSPISTNTGLSSNGCDYNAEYDYCSDTGSCTTTSDPSSNGPCGHRWCLCANYNGSETSGDTSNNGGDTSEDTSSNTIISTNTGLSSNGCDYNAEYDYCSDTGSCTTTSDPSSNGSCGHRYCLCANYNGSETSGDTSNNGDDSSTSEDTSSNTIISTNTGFSSNGCDYNAEYDYCSDTGSCTTTSDPSSNGPCGHRYCLCAQ